MARFKAASARRATAPVMLPILLAVLISAAGCGGLDATLRDATLSDSEERADALLELEERVRDLGARSDEDDRADREKLDGFLRQRYGEETAPTLRAQLLSIALQGELPCASELALRAANDPQWQVRLAAVHGIVETRPAESLSVLTKILKSDRDLLVRVEAAKAFRAIGDASWERPLAEVVADEAEDRNLRIQAWNSALVLTGAQLPFVSERWRERLKSGSQ